jgi:glycosyltransferase involved in cell wall biosynthesis
MPMTAPKDSIEILLSTYNGSAYLDALLESVIRQDHPSWSLLVRDDGSTDGTSDIVQNWRGNYPDKVRVIDEHLNNNLGAIRSFSRLLEHSSAAYVMFADQDDVWLADKVRLTMEAMQSHEAKVGASRPVLVHTDLMIVDEDLRVLSKSLWRYQDVVPGRNPKLSRIMVENCAWGCTTMLNRALVTTIGSIPPEAAYHDWWIALVASAFGDIVAVDRQSILYRRHEGNESEISDIRRVSGSALANPAAPRRRLARIFEKSRPQVVKLLDLYRERLAPDQIAAAQAFLRLPEQSFWGRRLDILRHGLVFSGMLRTLGLLVLI